jgi:hypothetical protein
MMDLSTLKRRRGIFGRHRFPLLKFIPVGKPNVQQYSLFLHGQAYGR